MGTLKIRGIGPIAIMSRIIYNIRDMKGGGIVDNGYTKRIRERVLSLEDGTVFVMSDFADIADTSTIRQSLSRLSWKKQGNDNGERFQDHQRRQLYNTTKNL